MAIKHITDLSTLEELEEEDLMVVDTMQSGERKTMAVGFNTLQDTINDYTIGNINTSHDSNFVSFDSSFIKELTSQEEFILPFDAKVMVSDGVTINNCASALVAKINSWPITLQYGSKIKGIKDKTTDAYIYPLIYGENDFQEIVSEKIYQKYNVDYYNGKSHYTGVSSVLSTYSFEIEYEDEESEEPIKETVAILSVRTRVYNKQPDNRKSYYGKMNMQIYLSVNNDYYVQVPEQHFRMAMRTAACKESVKERYLVNYYSKIYQATMYTKGGVYGGSVSKSTSKITSFNDESPSYWYTRCNTSGNRFRIFAKKK